MKFEYSIVIFYYFFTSLKCVELWLVSSSFWLSNTFVHIVCTQGMEDKNQLYIHLQSIYKIRTSGINRELLFPQKQNPNKLKEKKNQIFAYRRWGDKTL